MRDSWSALRPETRMLEGMIDLAKQRRTMIDDHLVRRGIDDPRILDAFARVPREDYVPAELAELAYDDGPLRIAHGQTISQPYIVALTIASLKLRGNERVLEVGTGSGYAAAILGELAKEVYTVERIAELAEAAALRLAEHGHTNVHVRTGDGSLGWPENAPYDAIAVAAGGPRVPEALIDQLAIGGRLVIPIGDDPSTQKLVRVTKRSATEAAFKEILDVKFVPLIGAQGWERANDGGSRALLPSELRRRGRVLLPA